ncbi:MAG TPA: MBOAT family O-acyltransferase [Pyrinomonadaceae bacterium]|nr:MBOAT family O-acyltransferase [Pyrinomonadaceae bacterium]
MLFTEPLFLFLFLPALLAIYFASPRPIRNAVLLTASFLFYAWGQNIYVVVLLISILLNYWLGRAIGNFEEMKPRRLIVALAIAANLLLLGSFKYPAFIVLNLNRLLGMLDLSSIPSPRSHLPVGISFFTLMGMSYVIDVYRKQIKPEKKFHVFLLYLTLFPYLIAGPIVRYAGIAKELVERHVSLGGFAAGIRRFTIGLGKKMLISSTLGLTVDTIFKVPFAELEPGIAWLGAVAYALQLYFDVSGYTDMAIGLGLMFGFHLPENFNYPYVAQSVTDFWQRWHMTLVGWFRDYLFFPLSYRRPTWRIHLNLIIVFVLCGFWHEGSWKFVVWGFAFGSVLAVERMGFAKLLARWPRLLRHLYVVFVILVTCILVRAPSLSDALRFYQAMFALNSGRAGHVLSTYLTPMFLLALSAGILGCLPLAPTIRNWQESLSSRLGDARGNLLDAGFGVFNTASLAVIFLCSVSLSAAGTYSPFIYFKF